MAEVSSRDGTNRLLCDRHYRNGDSKGILFFGGGSYTLDGFASAGTDGLTRSRSMMFYGFPVASCSVDWLWGNSTMVARIVALRTAAQTRLFTTGKVHIFATSMGALSALNYAKQNPTLVQSMALAAPAVDVQDIYDNDRGGYQTGADSIDVAYGGRPPDAYNPADNTATLSAIPQKVWYSTNDFICEPSTVTGYASAVGAETVNMGAIGHAFTIDDNVLMNFFLAHD